MLVGLEHDHTLYLVSTELTGNLLYLCRNL